MVTEQKKSFDGECAQCVHSLFIFSTHFLIYSFVYSVIVISFFLHAYTFSPWILCFFQRMYIFHTLTIYIYSYKILIIYMPIDSKQHMFFLLEDKPYLIALLTSRQRKKKLVVLCEMIIYLHLYLLADDSSSCLVNGRCLKSNGKRSWIGQCYVMHPCNLSET
jgi:hypothetical protein